MTNGSLHSSQVRKQAVRSHGATGRVRTELECENVSSEPVAMLLMPIMNTAAMLRMPDTVARMPQVTGQNATSAVAW